MTARWQERITEKGTMLFGEGVGFRLKAGMTVRWRERIIECERLRSTNSRHGLQGRVLRFS